jgi:hypothetical protein
MNGGNTMEFKIGEDEFKRQKRHEIIGRIFIIFIAIGATFGFIDETRGKIPPIAVILAIAVLLVILLYALRREYRKMIAGMKDHKLLVEDNRLTWSSAGMKFDFYLDNIKSVRIQSRKKHLDSIVLTNNSNASFKLKGYDRMEQLLDIIRKYVPPSAIKEYKWFRLHS